MTLPLRKRREIVFLTRHRLGPKLTPKQVANELAVDKKTVHRWLRVFDATNNVEEQSRKGRPRATSGRDDRKLRRSRAGAAEGYTKAAAEYSA